MLKTKKITGKIVLKSGLHIGGNKETLQIGGIDNPVIKNPITNEPYIPGSSLKGKTRFLLEHYYGLVTTSGDIPGVKATGDNDWDKNKIAIIYGYQEEKPKNNPENIDSDDINSSSVTNQEEKPIKPTRVIFSDSKLLGVMNDDGTLETNKEKLKQKILSDFVESKTEVAIDRITGTVNKKGGLRTIERVPAGVVFDLEVILKSYEPDEEAEFLDILLKGLKLLQNDALGGSGSRGSGRIEIRDLKVDGVDTSLDDITL